MTLPGSMYGALVGSVAKSTSTLLSAYCWHIRCRTWLAPGTQWPGINGMGPGGKDAVYERSGERGGECRRGRRVGLRYGTVRQRCCRHTFLSPVAGLSGSRFRQQLCCRRLNVAFQSAGESAAASSEMDRLPAADRGAPIMFLYARRLPSRAAIAPACAFSSRSYRVSGW
jgi:DNA-directed RNA polymerase subunit N (RpoN/RPB10)